MRTVSIAAVVAFCAIIASGESVISVDTQAIDRHAQAEISKRYPTVDGRALRLKGISWTKRFGDGHDPAHMPPVSINYDILGTTSTNVVGTEQLEKRQVVSVWMNEDGTVPVDAYCVQLSTVTSPVLGHQRQSEPGTTIALSFGNAPLSQVLQFYSELKGVPVSSDAAEHGGVNCVSTKGLTKEEACRFIETILSEQGIRLVTKKDGSVVATDKENPQSARRGLTH